MLHDRGHGQEATTLPILSCRTLQPLHISIHRHVLGWRCLRFFGECILGREGLRDGRLQRLRSVLLCHFHNRTRQIVLLPLQLLYVEGLRLVLFIPK